MSAFDVVDGARSRRRIAVRWVEQPTQIELSVNLKTARYLAIDVPTEIQQLADRVIE
jgi:hypothetical protein